MRKVMIMASMLAMVMLAASPAMAQNGQFSAQNAEGNNINQLSQQCQNIIGDINVEGGDNNAAISDDDANAAAGGDGGDAAAGNVQYNAGEAQYGGDQESNAAGGDGGDAAVSDDDVNAIAQENNTTVNVVQNCFQAAAQANVDIDAEVPEAPAPDDDQYVAPEAPAPDDDQYVAPEAPSDVIVNEGDKVIIEGDTVFVKNVFFEEGDKVIITEADKKFVVEQVVVEGGEKVVKVEAPAPEAEDDAVTVLPDTGGASLFTLGAGALLVTGGLLARRIVR